MTVYSNSEMEMRNLDTIVSVCDNFGLAISKRKTEIKHQIAPNTPYKTQISS